MNEKINKVLQFVKENPSRSSKEIYEGLNTEMGYATIKRYLSQLVSDKLIVPEGKGRGTKYLMSAASQLF